MGRLMYGADTTFMVDDLVLVHLRLVVMNKLRRGESFMLTLASQDGEGGRRSLWMAPPIAHHFALTRASVPAIDREVLEAMIQQASDPDGLDLRPYTGDFNR